MDPIDFTPGSTAIGGLSKGSGGSIDKKGGGGDPPHGHYYSKGGDTKAALRLYDIKAAKAYILEWRSCSLN
jgi:hypothetical protein